jgi:hypothetical protein
MAAPRREFSMPAEDRSLEALLDDFLIQMVPEWPRPSRWSRCGAERLDEDAEHERVQIGQFLNNRC